MPLSLFTISAYKKKKETKKSNVETLKTSGEKKITRQREIPVCAFQYSAHMTFHSTVNKGRHKVSHFTVRFYPFHYYHCRTLSQRYHHAAANLATTEFRILRWHSSVGEKRMSCGVCAWGRPKPQFQKAKQDNVYSWFCLLLITQ